MYFFKKILFLLFIFSINKLVIAAPYIEVSHESGFYKDQIDVSITASNSFIRIFYTLDGSTPNPRKLNTKFVYRNNFTYPDQSSDFLTKEQNTFVYDGSIKITDRSGSENSIANFNTTIPPEMPVRAESLKNKIIDGTNKAIVFTNRSMNDVVKYYFRYIKRLDDFPKKSYLSPFQYEYVTDKFTFNMPKHKFLKGTPLRVLAFNTKNHKTQEYSYIYFIGSDFDNIKLPIVNFTIAEEDLFNYENGTFVAGKAYDNFLKIPKSKDIPFHRRTANWHNQNKHNSFISVFNNKQLGFSKSTQFKIHGLSSRKIPNKSIRAYFKFKTLDNHIFPDVKHRGKTRIVFRNSGGSYATTYLNDAVFTQILKPIGITTQAYQPYVSFINGEYNGILNARERRDEYYIKNKYQLPSTNIDHIKNTDEVSFGSKKSWFEFINFIENVDTSSSEFFEKIQQHIDIDNFINYHIAEIFIANMDWLTNNIAVWRYKGEQSVNSNLQSGKYNQKSVNFNNQSDHFNDLSKETGNSHQFTDGRWRWLLYDIDDSGNYYDRNTLDYFLNLERKKANVIIKNLLNNNDIKRLFVQRFSDLLNTHFLSEKTIPIVKKLADNIAPEMPRHIQRWGNPESIDSWQHHLGKLTEFLEQRPTHQWQHLKETFNLGQLSSIKITLPKNNSISIIVNSVNIGANFLTSNGNSYEWQGKYFNDYKMKISVESKSNDSDGTNNTFSHWEIKTDNNADQVEIITNPTIEITPVDGMVLSAIYK